MVQIHGLIKDLYAELDSLLYSLCLSLTHFKDSFPICQVLSFTNSTDPNTTSLGSHGKLTEKKKLVKHKTENLAEDHSEPTRQMFFIWVLFCLRGVGGFLAHSHHEAYEKGHAILSSNSPKSWRGQFTASCVRIFYKCQCHSLPCHFPLP